MFLNLSAYIHIGHMTKYDEFANIVLVLNL